MALMKKLAALVPTITRLDVHRCQNICTDAVISAHALLPNLKEVVYEDNDMKA